MYHYPLINLYLLIGTCLAVFATNELPSTWKVCKRSDKNLNECLKTSIQYVAKDLKAGNAKFGLPPIDPLLIEQIVLRQGNGQAVGIDLTFNKLKMFGLSTMIVDKVSAQLDNNEIAVDFHVEREFRIESAYEAKGKVLLIPINGAGKSTLKFDNFKGNMILKLNKVKKGAAQHYNVNKCEIALDTTRLYLEFKRTRNVDQNLGNNINLILNENWKEILEDLKPAISQGFGVAFKDLANRVFSKVPIDKLLPA